MSFDRTLDLLTAKAYNFFPSVGTYVTYAFIIFVCSRLVGRQRFFSSSLLYCSGIMICGVTC